MSKQQHPALICGDYCVEYTKTIRDISQRNATRDDLIIATGNLLGAINFIMEKLELDKTEVYANAGVTLIRLRKDTNEKG